MLKDEKFYYRYDGEGNLILKSTRNVLVPPVMPQPQDWLDKLLSRTTPNKKELQAHYSWQEGDTAYEWYGNGMLKRVITPEGATIKFEYDALGRRTLKETHDVCHRYAWDGNVLLHEWSYDRREKPRMEKDELGRIRYDKPEPYTNLITWVYDGGSYTPVAKLTEEDSYTIVQDYLGTPIQALDSKGNVVWDCILDIYGDVLELRGERNFIPFRFQGQYEDGETGLYYNRFRYYSPETGSYISQDPIGLAGSNPTLYGYVRDTNSWVDPLGLNGIGPWGEKVAAKYLHGQGHKILGSVQNASGHGFDLVTKTSDGYINIIEVKTSQHRWRSKSNMSRWTDNNIAKISGNANGRWTDMPDYQHNLMETIETARVKGKLKNKLLQINIEKRSIRLQCK